MGLPKKILNAYDVEFIDSWAPPEGEDLRPLIGMPNIPKPLHHVNPRNLLGQNTWNHMRRRCYALADDTCEICGTKPENLRQRHAHEVYEIDYKKGTVKFVRAFCVCSLCHLGGIHTGRALTLWKQKNPLYPTEFLLKGAENAFRIIHEYNQEHPDNEVKAYSTCIGEGPFVCELFGEDGKRLRETGAEYGAKTGRPRRVGPIDLVATRYGVALQGATQIALTKLDVLSYMDYIPVCVRYRLDGTETDFFPFPGALSRAEPVIEYLDGWHCDISGIRHWDDLPIAAQRYVTYLEDAIHCPVRFISVGAERSSIIIK